MYRGVLWPFIQVFLIWTILVWVFDGMPLDVPNLEHFLNAALLVGVSAFVVFIMTIMSRMIELRGLRGHQAKKASSTIGPVPGYLPPAREKVTFSKKRWPLTWKWLNKQNDTYRSLFRAVLFTLGSRPNMPASPEPGGHGGATLIEHSLNVVETGLREASVFRVERSSSLVDGMALGEDAYDLMPILLLAHDLGKIVAFKMAPDDNRRVVNRKPYHDRESARLVALMDESWALSEDERKDLIMAQAHEHHPQDLPEHASDRARIMMEFLIHADRLASANEDRVARKEQPVYGKSKVSKQEQAKQQVDPIDPKSSGKASTPESVPINESKPDRPADKEANTGTGTGTGTDTSQEQMWEWLKDLIARPDSINGNNKNFRVGLWDGKRLFLNEASIRNLLAEEFYGNPERAREQTGDGRYKITRPLLEALDAAGVLVKTFDGNQWNAKNALFRIQSTDPKTGKLLQTCSWSSTIVLEFDHDTIPVALGAMSPAPKPPTIVAPVWGQHALRESGQAKAKAKAKTQSQGLEQLTDTTAADTTAADTTAADTTAADTGQKQGWDAINELMPTPNKSANRTTRSAKTKTKQAEQAKDAEAGSETSDTKPPADPIPSGKRQTPSESEDTKPPADPIPSGKRQTTSSTDLEVKAGQGDKKSEPKSSANTDPFSLIDPGSKKRKDKANKTAKKAETAQAAGFEQTTEQQQKPKRSFTEDDLYAQYEDN